MQHRARLCLVHQWEEVKWEGPHLVLLPLQPLHVVELLRLQLAHPIVQLVDLVPAGDTQTHHQRRPVTSSWRCGRPSARHVLQLVLVQVVDVELLAPGGQNLLLLLSLCLLLASSLLVGLERTNRAG